MLVISDASPLNILIRLGLVDVLPKLFGRIMIPTAVAAELSDPRAPEEVRAFMTAKPEWVSLATPTRLFDLNGVDEGECAAISLAVEHHADLLLIDDRRGRRAAQSLNVRIVGTIGILEAAANRGWFDLAVVFARLRATDFAVSDKLIDAVLQRWRESNPGDRQGL